MGCQEKQSKPNLRLWRDVIGWKLLFGVFLRLSVYKYFGANFFGLFDCYKLVQRFRVPNFFTDQCNTGDGMLLGPYQWTITELKKKLRGEGVSGFKNCKAVQMGIEENGFCVIPLGMIANGNEYLLHIEL